MMVVKLYSRQNCHLCEQAHADLQELQQKVPHHLEVVDVDQDPRALRQYGLEVPVVEAGPYVLKAPFSRQELQMTLSAAQDRERHIDAADQNYQEKVGARPWTRSDAFAYWFSRHYLTILNIFVLIYVGLPFLAPTLMKVGLTAPANGIYRVYSVACHQLAFRSFFLFGEQPVYPRAAAGFDEYLTYGQATGLPEGDSADAIYGARGFVGNEEMGYKVALCERDVAIYGAIFLFGVLFAMTGRRIGSLPWYLWLLFAIGPIAFDGISQLLSQPPFSFWPYRESTPYLRVLTGGLFGFFTAWFGYPLVEETMADSRQVLSDKLQRIRRMESRAAAERQT